MLYFSQIKPTKRVAYALFFLFSFFGYSQEVQLDPNFNAYDNGLLGDGFDGTVHTLSLQTDGKLVAGGEFLNFNGSASPYLCRLNADGTKDLGFNLGTSFNGKIYASVIQPDGKIIVAGAFTTYDGIPVGRLVRLNVDGSRDSSFDTTIGANSGTIYGLALQTDGKLVAVGSFTKYNETTVNRIARILPNGNLDFSFVTGTGATGTIYDVAIAQYGNIVLSGTFSSFNGNTNYSKLVRLYLDGNTDTSLALGSGFDGTIDALAVQPDGKIILGGSFSNYNGAIQNRILRLNTNGSTDASFLTGTGFSNGEVQAIQITSSGILVGGSFSGTYQSTNANRLVLLNSNGTLNTNFTIGSGSASGIVYALTASTDSFFVAGTFSVFDDMLQGKLAKINTSGVLDSSFLSSGVGFDKAVDKVILLPDKSSFVFGSFTQFNGNSVNRLVKFTAKGALDTTFNTNQSGPDSTVKDLVVQSDGKLVVAGNFTKYNGNSIKRLVRLQSDGAVDPTFNMGSGFNYMVYSIALQPDGKILVAGSFTTYKGVAVKKVIRLLPNGDLDTSFSFGTNPNDTPNQLLLQQDGKVLIGGDFTTFDGVASSKLIRLHSNGTVDTSFSLGTGFTGAIYAMALQPDQKIVIGGSISKYNGQTIGKIIRLNSDGTKDTSFLTGTGFSGGTVQTLAIQSNGRMLVGGSFSGNYNGIAVKRLVRLVADGTFDASFPISLNGQLNSISLLKGGAIIGGDFNSVSGISKHRFAKLLFSEEGTVWDGTTWSNGLPTLEKTAVFNGNYDLLPDTKAYLCVVNSGVTVTVNNAATLELASNFSGGGNLVFENNSTLFQADDLVVNTGSIQYKRKTTPVRKSDFTYWSSPVKGQQLQLLTSNASTAFYSFDSAINQWHKESINATMILGKGYIFKAPEDFSATNPVIFETVFSGVPSNGVVTIPIVNSIMPHLIGNPYPSALNADVFIMENQKVVQGSLYFWTHNTPADNGQYTSDDYAVYSLLGGVGTAAKTSGINTSIPNGKIAAGQAFFVLGANSGSIVFNNAMRLQGENSLFFKNGTAKSPIASFFEKHRIWLNLSNTKGLFKQLLVGYATGATNGKDILFEGLSLDTNEELDFYSVNEGNKYTIQARALPFDNLEFVPIGYRAKEAGDFTISLDNFDGLFANQTIYLEDQQEATIQDLKKEKYTFTTASGTFNNRFVLRFQNNKAVSQKVFTEVQIVTKNNQIQISNLNAIINEISLYSLEGKQLYHVQELNSKAHFIEASLWKSKVVIVHITLATGEVVNRKIVL
jgi:uncharacterized delta-60 repeat protein